MKRTHIVLLLLVAGLMVTFVASITEHQPLRGLRRGVRRPGTEYKVSGTLVTDMPVEYNPQQNTSLTKFHMKDREGVVHEVWLEKAKPTDSNAAKALTSTAKQTRRTSGPHNC